MPGIDGRAWLVVAGIILFWLGTLLAGAMVPGYSARDDYISSLAGRGSEVAVLGIATLAVLGTTHLIAASAIVGAVGAPLALAGLAGLTVAAFRTGCPGGAAGCGFAPDSAPPDLADTVHGLAVVGYEVAFLAAMLVVALNRARSVTATGTLLAAVVSALLALQIGGEASGLWQRGWLMVNTGWLAWLVLSSAGVPPPRAARRRRSTPGDT